MVTDREDPCRQDPAGSDREIATRFGSRPFHESVDSTRSRDAEERVVKEESSIKPAGYRRRSGEVERIKPVEITRRSQEESAIRLASSGLRLGEGILIQPVG